jgi:CBS-domain-containing membrane protein
MSGIDDIGKFAESGRGVAVALSRPGPALPMSPVGRHAYATLPRAHLGWAQGLTTVADVTLEPTTCALAPTDTLRAACRKMLQDEADYVPVCDGGRFVGAVFVEAVLQSVADDRTPPNLATVITSQIPTCGLHSLLVDAVRQMIACYLRKIPVVGDAGELVGMLTLSEAGAAAVRDPAVAEVIERFAGSPSLFARRLH